MKQRNIYKFIGQILLMGASEALVFLDILRDHGLLSRWTVAQYVLPSLYAGPEIREGTAAYQAMEESVGREVFDEMLGNRHPDVGLTDEPLSWETGHYLRRVIATPYVTGNMACHVLMEISMDTLSKPMRRSASCLAIREEVTWA
jgi:hypothetical protein